MSHDKRSVELSTHTDALDARDMAEIMMWVYTQRETIVIVLVEVQILEYRYAELMESVIHDQLYDPNLLTASRNVKNVLWS